MTEPRTHPDRSDDVAPDLVDLLMVAMADLDGLSTVVPALTELVHRSVIRILDLVVLVKDGDGDVSRLGLDAVDRIAPVRDLGLPAGALLSDHDLELASLALRHGTAGVIVLVEDRWAEPLSIAAGRAGGAIIAGERIPAARVVSALAQRGPDRRPGRPAAPRPGALHRRGTDLLARPPCAVGMDERRAALHVDPADQLEALADLRTRGLITREELTRQRAKVTEPWDGPRRR